ncbi:transglutaminase domain-containing protein [bacterium]|nr:transglutaminase domain-containing protein [bacterium]
MKRLTCMGTIFCLVGLLWGENYLINGGQESTILYSLNQRIEPVGDTQTLKLSFVIPVSFQSPTYNQRIDNFDLSFNPSPSERKDEEDNRGNHIIRVEWKNPKQPVDATMRFTATNKTILQTIQSQAPFPLTDIPRELRDYLSKTDQVQSEDNRIENKAKELVQGVTTEFDAVQRILTWIIDHMRYVTPPVQFDALYAFENGKGNCQNYSHLSAALMRSLGIPVRIVNGVTLKQPYSVKMADGDFTFQMGQGRHSWIEVYFPDLGWIPFDPQQTELFVSNRFIRIEIGLDNEETINDGMVRWRQAKGVQGRPRFTEVIDAQFSRDDVQLALAKQNYGPKNMLLSPKVDATFQPVVYAPPPPPKEIDEDELKNLRYTRRLTFGNVDFPRGVDFLFTRGPAEEEAEDEYAMRKNFMVETAEYVTTGLTQYAQVFVLEEPLQLNRVGLALHNFGGSGQVWIDLIEDDNGKPGRTLAASDFINLNQIPVQTGYDWVDFDFSNNPPILSPGKYWIGLGFTGSPIINWFYTYGKPVGPVDGTRYKSVYEEDWSGALAFEFNYRIMGLTSE